MLQFKFPNDALFNEEFAINFIQNFDFIQKDSCLNAIEWLVWAGWGPHGIEF